jgi:hypothetical protein
MAIVEFAFRTTANSFGDELLSSRLEGAEEPDLVIAFALVFE